MFFNQLQQPGPPMLPQPQGPMPGGMQSLPAQMPAGMFGGMQGQPPPQMPPPNPMMQGGGMQPQMGGGMGGGFDLQKILAMLQNSNNNAPMTGGLGSVPAPSLNMQPQRPPQANPMAMLQQMLMRR